MKKRPSASKNKRADKKRLLIIGLLAACLLAALAYAGYRVYTEKIKTSYLKNNNHVVCVTVAEKAGLRCENIQTGELRQFNLPEKYRTGLISPSPDGAKFLIETYSDDGVVVTDSNFNKIRKIFKFEDLSKTYPSFTWADGSKQLLIREIKREQNDADFLPPPVVVTMLDLETGESKRVYKTGEGVNVDSVEIIGGNDQYIFIAHDAVKNWVAKSVEGPPKIINAIRLSDGLVRQVNSYQVDMTKDNMPATSLPNIYYDDYRNILVFVGQSEVDLVTEKTIIARLVENNYGLVLEKVYEVTVPELAHPRPVLTSKGLAMEDGSQTLVIVDEQGNKTKLNLTLGDDEQLFSLPSMPNLPEA